MPRALKLLEFRQTTKPAIRKLFTKSQLTYCFCLIFIIWRPLFQLFIPQGLFFNSFFFSPQSGTCFANDYWTLALYLGNFKIIKISPINVLEISVKLLILNFSHSLKKVQEIIFPNLWPSLLARFIYTWSQTPEVLIVPGKEKKGKETHFMGSFIG